jgi:hypothetical protein
MCRTVDYLLALAVCGTALFYSGCAANEAILRSNTSSEPAANSQPTNVEPAKSSYEHDLEAMRTADFDYIFALRRKDGAKMDADDRAVVRAVTAEANRRSLSDDDKAVIVGANYPIVADKMKTLADRFYIEDFSKPPAERKPTSNSSPVAAQNKNTAPTR